jgi:hypothetical protein
MKPRVTALLCLLLWGSAAPGAERAQLEHVKTEWQNAYGVIIYTVLADVKNVSGTPLQYAKIKVVLADKDGKTVAVRDGYNLGAEILGDEGIPGSLDEKLKRVKPIAPGSTDLVRISLDKSDIGKPFRTATVSIIDVR